MKNLKFKPLNLLYLVLAVVFVWYFKICVDNWNRDAEVYNKRMKEHCPCEKWHYVTKGLWLCDCPNKR